MEAKVFFSKSRNIFSVAVLLAGITVFSAGVVSNINIREMHKNDIHKIQEMQKSLNIGKEEKEKYKNEIRSLLQQNDKLKKEITTYKNRSESPSQIMPSRGEETNKTVTMEITGYTAGYESTQKKKGDPNYGRTTSGTYVKEGRTVACPRSMEFGTKVNIQGLGLRVCEDRGGAITEGHLDVYFESVSDALELGRKRLAVEILN